MKTYIGTKVLRATPMNRLEYNNVRGWTLPADENGADEGYLVEYTDGGKPNTTTHAGYVSWSPKEQFDRAYVETDPTNPLAMELDASVATFINAMRKDPDYAWAWHCNIAMSAFDAGCPHGVANEGAARFLQLLAGVDTRQHPGFAPTQTPVTATLEQGLNGTCAADLAHVRIVGEDTGLTD